MRYIRSIGKDGLLLAHGQLDRFEIAVGSVCLDQRAFSSIPEAGLKLCGKQRDSVPLVQTH